MKAPLPTTRRTVLAGTGAGFVVALTAACSGNAYVAPAEGFSVPEASDTGDDPDPEDPIDLDAEGEETEAEEGALATLDDIPVGTAKSVKTADGKEIIISRLTTKKVAAFSAICTHQGCTVAPQGQSLDCPCHGAKFDYKTGEVTNGPAEKALASYSVHVKNGSVLPGDA